MTGTGETCGALFVVGGAEDRSGARLILRQFVEAAGGADARILIIATASTMPEEVMDEYRDAFGDLGIGHLDLAAPGKPAQQAHPM